MAVSHTCNEGSAPYYKPLLCFWQKMCYKWNSSLCVGACIVSGSVVHPQSHVYCDLKA